jgi:hypothetical protein
MKQTAVEWLHEQLLKILIDNQIQQTDYLFEQAKAMEKEQIKDAYNSDRDLLSRIEDGSAFNEYYNETYGGKDEL